MLPPSYDIYALSPIDRLDIGIVFVFGIALRACAFVAM